VGITEEGGVTLRRRGVGFAALGPAFYTWDVEPWRVVDMAAELAAASTRDHPTHPVRRLRRSRRRPTRRAG